MAHLAVQRRTAIHGSWRCGLDFVVPGQHVFSSARIIRAVMCIEKCPFTSRRDCVAGLHRRAVGERRYLVFAACCLRNGYWHASHVGSSIAQNLMSVAGVASICAFAAAAAASSALVPPPEDTAFRRPDCTVDFSACVALIVRR